MTGDYKWLEEDYEKIENIAGVSDAFKDSAVLITGATGLIGSMLCRTLAYLSDKNNWGLQLLVQVRDTDRAKEKLMGMDNPDSVFFFNKIDEIGEGQKVDYIVHTACPTKSDFFITKPVETIKAIVYGTDDILRLAMEKKSRSIVYLSSMEAYGEITEEKYLEPDDVGYISPSSLRSSYPEGKRLSELLCISYNAEFNVPVKVVRLSQTFGPGIPKDDKKVFAHFIRSVLEGENIVMFTEGGSKRMFLDTLDAVRGLITILLKGESGKVYNLANEDNYCSIRDMAELVIKMFGSDNTELVIDRSKDIGQYPPDNMLRLNTSDVRKLGWIPEYSLVEMYERMIKNWF